MVGKEFIDIFKSFQSNANLSVDDFADRLNLFTVVLLVVSTLFISLKQYVFNSISCYIPVQPSGSDFSKYLSDYCWVHGTIPLRSDEMLPTTEDQWNKYDQHRRITYYQWVPFVLGLQAIMFYLPHLLWEAICNTRAGGDVFALIQAAGRASSAGSRADRRKQVQRVAEFLEDMIDTHSSTRNNRRSRTVDRMQSNCGLCIVSKRLGTCLVWSYILFKVIIILNCIGQLYLIQTFLGFTGTYLKPAPFDDVLHGRTAPYRYGERKYGFSFGWAVAKYIRSGQDWSQTLLFPRVAYCRVPSIRVVGGENAYTAQCALPINMLNEKLYIFLWFWIVFLLCVAIGSLFIWLLRSGSPFHRHRYIARFLRSCRLGEADHTERVDVEKLKQFVDQYLHPDGVFLVRMVAINVGQVTAADVIGELWKAFIERTSKESADFRETSIGGGGRDADAPLKTPSAPVYEKKPMFEVGFV